MLQRKNILKRCLLNNGNGVKMYGVEMKCVMTINKKVDGSFIIYVNLTEVVF